MDQASAVIARWEWRTFAPSLAGLEVRAGAIASVPPRVTDEIYLLSPNVAKNAKIREGVLDIKTLDLVAHDGLEQWKPIFKAKFPLSQADIRAAFEILDVPTPAMLRPTYDLVTFLDELIPSASRLNVVKVRKSRRSFNWLGCMAEFVDIDIDGFNQQGLCIESENLSALTNALSELGLRPHDNTSFPAGLKRLMPHIQRFAAVGTGGNDGTRN